MQMEPAAMDTSSGLSTPPQLGSAFACMHDALPAWQGSYDRFIPSRSAADCCSPGATDRLIGPNGEEVRSYSNHTPHTLAIYMHT